MKRSMKKSNILIVSSIIVLVAITGVFAFLNSAGAGQNKTLEEEAAIIITSNGENIAKIDMELFERAGLTDFYADLDTSKTGASRHLYTGIPLNSALQVLDIDIGDYSVVIAKASDGYTVTYDSDEIKDKDNAYIAIKRDGNLLGTRREGGEGPYQIIIRKDAFSQRWCKFLIELELVE